MQELHDTINVLQNLGPVAVAATANGTGVDLQGYTMCEFLFAIGVVTDGTYAFEIQESDDNSTFTAVGDGDLIGTEPTGITTTTDDQLYKVGYKGSKRYVRYAVTETAAGSTGGIMSVIVLRGGARHQPVA